MSIVTEKIEITGIIGELYYQKNSKDNPTIILLRGGGLGNIEQYVSFAHDCVKVGYTVIKMELEEHKQYAECFLKNFGEYYNPSIWIFAFIARMTIFELACVYYKAVVVPETHFNLHPLNVKTIIKNSFEVMRHRLFMALVILMGLAYSLIITFNTAGSFLIQTVLHHSPVFFGHMALCIGIVFLASTFTCRYLLKKFKVESLLFYAIIISFVIALLSVALSFTFEKSTLFVVVFSALMFFSCGFIFPMSMGRGISLFHHIAGTATALMYLIQILMTGFVSFLVSLVHVENNTDIMVMYFILLLCAAVVYWGMIRRNE